MVINRGVYEHFKGNKYLVIDTEVLNTEQGINMIYYKALYYPYKTYVKPEYLFTEMVWKNGAGLVPRYKFLFYAESGFPERFYDDPKLQDQSGAIL